MPRAPYQWKSGREGSRQRRFISRQEVYVGVWRDLPDSSREWKCFLGGIPHFGQTDELLEIAELFDGLDSIVFQLLEI